MNTQVLRPSVRGDAVVSFAAGSKAAQKATLRDPSFVAAMAVGTLLELEVNATFVSSLAMVDTSFIENGCPVALESTARAEELRRGNRFLC